MRLAVSKDIVVVAVGDKLIVGTRDCLRSPLLTNAANSAPSNGVSKSLAVIDHENWQTKNLEEPEELGKNSSENGSGQKVQKLSTPHNVGLVANRPDIENTRWFSAVAVSSRGNYVAAADNLKTLFVYRVKDERGILIQKPVSISRQALAKRSMALTFTEDEGTVVVADKLGDVYTFETEVKSRSEVVLPILGHISVITDVILSPDEKFILTGDRDEKIRVSHYPLADDIQSFCLGHTKFITRLLIPIPAHPVVISGSGDSSIRAFNYLTGEELGAVFCLDSDYSQTDIDGTQAHVVALTFHSETQTLLAALSRKNVILGYKIHFTTNEDGKIGKVTFIPSVRLPQSAAITSLGFLEDSLVVLQSDPKNPSVCIHQFTRLVQSGVGESGQERKTQTVPTDLEEALLSCLHQIASVLGGLESVLRDPYADLFSPSSRQVVEEMADLSTEMGDSGRKKETEISAKKKKRSCEIFDGGHAKSPLPP